MSERTTCARPRWSRDGRFIYFASNRGGGDWQLWRVGADAEDPEADAVQLTRSSGMEAEESADGRYVYYAKRGLPGVFRFSLGAQGAAEEKVLDIGGEDCGGSPPGRSSSSTCRPGTCRRSASMTSRRA
jgi:Tol biopolymer transport system component